MSAPLQALALPDLCRAIRQAEIQAWEDAEHAWGIRRKHNLRGYASILAESARRLAALQEVAQAHGMVSEVP